MKLLLIDDSLVFRRAQKKVLVGQLGVEHVSEAANGKEALGILEENGYDFDVVILDINMPVMSGIETLNAIRAKAPELPVVMCTSEAEKKQVLSALNAGANTYLLKPVRKPDLEEKVMPFLEACSN